MGGIGRQAICHGKTRTGRDWCNSVSQMVGLGAVLFCSLVKLPTKCNGKFPCREPDLMRLVLSKDASGNGVKGLLGR